MTFFSDFGRCGIWSWSCPAIAFEWWFSFYVDFCGSIELQEVGVISRAQCHAQRFIVVLMSVVLRRQIYAHLGRSCLKVSSACFRKKKKELREVFLISKTPQVTGWVDEGSALTKLITVKQTPASAVKLRNVLRRSGNISSIVVPRTEMVTWVSVVH